MLVDEKDNTARSAPKDTLATRRILPRMFFKPFHLSKTYFLGIVILPETMMNVMSFSANS